MLTGNQQLMKEINRMAIIKLLQTHGLLSRAEIARVANLSRSTVSGLVSELIDLGIVIEQEKDRSKGGRKPMLLSINEAGGVILGIDLGGTKIVGGVVNLRAQVLKRLHRPTPKDPDEVVVALIELIRDLLDTPEAIASEIKGIGIACPGLVDREHGTVVDAGNLRWRNVPLEDKIKKEFGLLTVIENDTNAAALGEKHYGVGTGVDSLIYVAIGTGIGAGLIVNGLLFRGAFNGAGEVGHMHVLDSGPQCVCGRRGCLEALTSGPAIGRRAVELLLEGRHSSLLMEAYKKNGALTAEEVALAAKEGDTLATAVFTEAGRYIGLALGNLANSFNPSMIVLGGGVAKAGTVLLEPVRQAVNEIALTSHNKGLQVVLTSLGDDAGIVGAATLVLNQLFSPVDLRRSK
ncbi:ROK family glucokinase [Moorella naiadis]|uniref:ROK family protein n=1 Tax=Moorella naiadis (nom. illeg.) TaxID=3093670 RepID=UPI003D9CA577